MTGEKSVQIGPVERYKGGYQYADLYRLYDTFSKPAYHPYKTYNLYGIVVDWDADYKRANTSKNVGGDYYRSYTLTDVAIYVMYQKREIDDKTMKLVCFAPDPSQLPAPRAAGDIIRWHRVMIQNYNGPQIVASLQPKKGQGPPAAFCMWQGRKSDSDESISFEPYQRSSASYHWSQKEANVVSMLREFVQDSPLLNELLLEEGSHAGPKHNKYRRTFNEILSEEYSDSIEYADVQGIVLHVKRDIFVPDNTDAYSGHKGTPNFKRLAMNSGHMIYLWDGSDARLFPISCDNRSIKDTPEDADENQKQYMKIYAKFMQSLRRQDFYPMEIENDIKDKIVEFVPGTGTALPIAFPPCPPESRQTALPEAGTCIRLRNCGFHIINGQVQGIFLTNSKWQPAAGSGIGVDPEDEIVTRVQYRKRAKTPCTFAPENPDFWASEVNHEHRHHHFTTIRQIYLWCCQCNVSGGAEETNTPAYFRALVQVTGFSPSLANVTAWCTQSGENTDINNDVSFDARLILTDSTGTIDNVELSGMNAELFFSRTASPGEVAKGSEDTIRQFTHKLVSLLETRESDHDLDIYPHKPSKAPWLEVCIQATRNREDPKRWLYSIFDTVLK